MAVAGRGALLPCVPACPCPCPCPCPPPGTWTWCILTKSKDGWLEAPPADSQRVGRGGLFFSPSVQVPCPAGRGPLPGTGPIPGNLVELVMEPKCEVSRTEGHLPCTGHFPDWCSDQQSLSGSPPKFSPSSQSSPSSLAGVTSLGRQADPGECRDARGGDGAKVESAQDRGTPPLPETLYRLVLSPIVSERQPSKVGAPHRPARPCPAPPARWRPR